MRYVLNSILIFIHYIRRSFLFDVIVFFVRCNHFFCVENYIRVEIFIFVSFFARFEKEKKEKKNEMCDLYKR